MGKRGRFSLVESTGEEGGVRFQMRVFPPRRGLSVPRHVPRYTLVSGSARFGVQWSLGAAGLTLMLTLRLSP